LSGPTLIARITSSAYMREAGDLLPAEITRLLRDAVRYKRACYAPRVAPPDRLTARFGSAEQLE